MPAAVSATIAGVPCGRRDALNVSAQGHRQHVTVAGDVRAPQLQRHGSLGDLEADEAGAAVGRGELDLPVEAGAGVGAEEGRTPDLTLTVDQLEAGLGELVDRR